MDLGLDTSTKRLAWHGGIHGTVGFFDAEADNPEQRRIELFNRARALFASLPQGSWVFCEEPLALPKNGKTTRLLGLAAGAVWAAYTEFDLTWAWVDASAWKGREHGIGLANIKKELGLKKDKDAVKVWGERQLDAWLEADARRGYSVGFREIHAQCPDLYDAWAIRQWGIKARDERGL